MLSIKRKKHFSSRNLRSPLVGHLFILPALVIIGSFLIYPLIYNILISFKEVTVQTWVSGTSPFTGLSNYLAIFSDSDFWQSFQNTMIYAFSSLVFMIMLGFAFALIFNRTFPLSRILRGLMMIPWFMPLIATGGAGKWFFSERGTVNALLQNLGVISQPVNWLTNPSIVLWTVILINIWIGTPFNFILLHTGLQGIPHELQEAAIIDGANRWQRIRYITFPLLKPVMAVAVMLNTIYCLKNFDIVWVVTRGGPGTSSHLFATFAYKLAFLEYRFGLAASVTNIMVGIILALVVVYFYIIAE